MRSYPFDLATGAAADRRRWLGSAPVAPSAGVAAPAAVKAAPTATMARFGCPSNHIGPLGLEAPV